MPNLTVGIPEMRAGRFYAISQLAHKPYQTFIIVSSTCHHLHVLKVCTQSSLELFLSNDRMAILSVILIYCTYCVDLCFLAERSSQVETRAYLKPWTALVTPLTATSPPATNWAGSSYISIQVNFYTHLAKAHFQCCVDLTELAEAVLQISDKLPRENISPN